MKNILAVLTVSISLCVSAFQTQAQQNAFTIEGVLKEEKLKPLKIYQVEQGELKEIASCVPDMEGQFGFHFYPAYEGLFVLGTGEATSAVDNYLFWFKKGDKLKVELARDNYTLVNGSEENKLLEQWYQVKREVQEKSINFMRNRSDYTDFFPALDITIPAAKQWLSTVKVSNSSFQKTLNKLVRLELGYYAVNFLQTPRSVHPKREEIPAYYANFDLQDLMIHTDDIYFYPWGKRVANLFVLREKLRLQRKMSGGLEGLRNSLELIKNDTLKGDFILSYAEKIRDYSAYMELKKDFGQYILTAKQQALDFEIQKPLAALKPGDKGFEFTFEDNTGKQVSFSDFRGKILLIDLWATWCGPCKAEFPALRQLKKDFEGTDVVVMGISVDADKDKAKWKQMIIDEQLGGVQLLAGPGNKVSQYYKVTGIPRFMIFDKEGKIVTIDAPRPSNPELKVVLQKLLSGS